MNLQVGDKVRLIQSDGDYKLPEQLVGVTGTVISITRESEQYPVVVDWGIPMSENLLHYTIDGFYQRSNKSPALVFAHAYKLEDVFKL